MEGFYINLKNRTDRKRHMEKLKQKYPIFKNIQRDIYIYIYIKENIYINT